MRMSGQIHAPGHFNSRRKSAPGTSWTEKCVDSKPVRMLFGEVKKNYIAFVKNRAMIIRTSNL